MMADLPKYVDGGNVPLSDQDENRLAWMGVALQGLDKELARANNVSDQTRDGETGARNDGAIGFASLRGGTVVGEHQVFLAGPGERITLSHSAEDRSIVARGALAAARWGQGKKPGLYGMSDVLGL